jgi:hypothetical protein
MTDNRRIDANYIVPPLSGVPGATRHPLSQLGPSGKSPKSVKYLVIAIAITLLICAVFVFIAMSEAGYVSVFLLGLSPAIPLGIIAIMQATKAAAAKQVADIPENTRMNRKARTWSLAAVIYALVVFAVFLPSVVNSVASHQGSPQVRLTVSALKSLSIAQDSYRKKHGVYTSNLSDVGEPFSPDPSITIIVLNANKNHWAAVARHPELENYIVYDSKKGLLR